MNRRAGPRRLSCPQQGDDREENPGAHKTLRNVRSAWVEDQQVRVRDGAITDYQVDVMVVLDDSPPVVKQQTAPGRDAAPASPAQQITWRLRAGRYVAVPTASRDSSPRAATMAEQVEAARRALKPRGAASAGAATWHWDLATGSVAWDDGLRVLFGYGEELTDAAWRRDLIHPGDRERVEVSLQRATLRNDGHPWSERYRLHQADGSYAHVGEQAYVLHDDAGPRSVVGAITPRPLRQPRTAGPRAAAARRRSSE